MPSMITETFVIACNSCGEDVVGPLTYDLDDVPGLNADGYMIMPPHRESYDWTGWDAAKRRSHPNCCV